MNKMARSVFILNFILGGGGDHALGNKIKDLVINMGANGMLMTCQGSVRCLKVIGKVKFGQKPIDYANPILIVAPYSLISSEDLPSIIRQFNNVYEFTSDTIIMIDEMDSSRDINDYDINYKTAILPLKFKSIVMHSLGFLQKSIGYFPMPDSEVIRITQNSKKEIIKCLDSYNLSLPYSCDLYLAYLSSSSVITSAYTFIINTLIEDRDRKNNSVYLLVVREDNQIPAFINRLKYLLPDKKYINLFSRRDFSTLHDSEHLNIRGSTSGKGEKTIHICMTKSMPINMFKNFTHRCHKGMMSGDQSLSDYISLKHHLPYYDKQPWKDPLAKGLFEQAKKQGGPTLLEKIESLIVGRNGQDTEVMARILDPGYVQTQSQKNDLKEFNHTVYSKQADQKIKEILLKYL